MPIACARMVEEGATIRAMADDLDAGHSTIRYWLKRLGLETSDPSVEGKAMPPQSRSPQGIPPLPQARTHSVLRTSRQWV